MREGSRQNYWIFGRTGQSPGVGERDNGQETFSQDQKKKDSEEGLREELMPTPSLPCSGGTQKWAKLEREQVVWASARARTKRPKEGDLRYKTTANSRHIRRERKGRT